MTPTELIAHLDQVLADNDEFRDNDWPSIRTLVECGKLPAEALEHPVAA